MTLQEIQYKAQSIISKWRDDDSAPYIELVEELAHMTVPEPSEDLGEAAWRYASKECEKDAFIAGAKWQADHTPLPEDTVLFNKGVEEGKRLMTEEAVEGKVRNIIIHENGDEVHYSITYPKGSIQYSINDKVKIIIL